jgi:ferrous-iron efflux pump FieF
VSEANTPAAGETFGAAASSNRAPLTPAAVDRLKRLAATASIAVALTLIAAKLGAWLATSSVSLLSTLIDSLLDLAASVVNFIAIRHAAQPADREHRFGHGKAEPIAGFAQAAFVSGSAGFLLIQSVERLINPTAVNNEIIGIGVMVLSIVMTLALVLFQRSVVRRTGSVAINADQLHYQSDLLVNASVIVALLLAWQFHWFLADPLFAIAIAGYILYSAREILVHSFDMLMDKELPDADRRRIVDIAEAQPGVISVHDLRTRLSGSRVFIQIHLELNGELRLWDAHTIAEGVMKQIEEAFPNAEVLIHEDPHGVREKRDTFEE